MCSNGASGGQVNSDQTRPSHFHSADMGSDDDISRMLIPLTDISPLKELVHNVITDVVWQSKLQV